MTYHKFEMRSKLLILGLLLSLTSFGQGWWYAVESETTPPAEDTTSFIMEFAMGASETLTIPLFNATGYNFTINWGDGSSLSTIDAYNDEDLAHTYSSAGNYQVKLSGTVKGIYFNNGGSKSKLTKILQWGHCGFTTFKSAFWGCTNLVSLPDTSITGASAVASDAFRETFKSCSGIDSIYTDLFKLCPNVSTSGFYETFRGCTGLTAISSDLFRYCTSVSSNAFYGTFRGCTGLINLPQDVFRYNVSASTYAFYQTFYGCTALASTGSNLFKYNTSVSSYGFYQTFYECNKLQLNSTMFYADGDQSTRFLNKTCNFTQCFYRESFTGTQGTAPDLWNCDFGETITLDVAPTTDWATDDYIEGQTSGAYSKTISKVSTLVYKIKELVGPYELGEIVGVTGNSNKLADQGSANPIIANTPTGKSTYLAGAGNDDTSVSNYNQSIGWK